MRKILGIYNDSEKQEKSTSENINKNTEYNNNDKISDNDLLSNPFFQTLKPLN